MTQDRSFWPNAVRPPLLFGIFWSAIYWVLIPFSWRRTYAKDRRFQNQFIAEFSDATIEMHSVNFDSTIRWEFFSRSLESSELFLLYPTPRLFHVIPKRSFAPGEADEFRALLKSKLPSK